MLIGACRTPRIQGSRISTRAWIQFLLAAFFFVYGVVIRANKVSAGKELPNSLFRGKLQTRKPLPPDGYLRREAGLTTGKATVRYGMSGRAEAKDSQIVLNEDSSVLDRVGNG